MKSTLSILFAFLLAAPTFAATVWAPGVSDKGGYFDYNKQYTGSDEPWKDSGMCWAATASNVIAWWQSHNAQDITSTIPVKDNVWNTFRAVFLNVGATPIEAYKWWINGEISDQYFDYNHIDGNKETDEKALSWTYEGSTFHTSILANGGFLKDYYDFNTVRIASSQSDKDPSMHTQILDALAEGYALSLSLYDDAGNHQVGHGITLWGAEYDGTGDDRRISYVWVTDSDDGTEPDMKRYKIAEKDDSTPAFDAGSGNLTSLIIRYADGMKVERIPEPATSALSLLTLAALAARRRRR